MTIHIVAQSANFVKKNYCCNKQVHEAEKIAKGNRGRNNPLFNLSGDSDSAAQIEYFEHITPAYCLKQKSDAG